MGDIEPSVLHVVDETVFFIDVVAVFALQVTREGVGFPDSFHTAGYSIFKSEELQASFE